MQTEYSWGDYIKDYWFLLKGRRLKFVIFTLLRAASNTFSFVNAYFIAQIIDFFSAYKKGDPLLTFYIYVVLIGFFGAFQVWLRFASKLQLQTIGAEIRKESRLLAINKLIEMDIVWHEKENTGAKIQKINDGGEAIFTGFKDFSNEGLSILSDLIAALVLLYLFSWKYFAFALVYLVAYLLAEYYFNKRLDYLQNELSKIKEKVSGKITESTSNILAVKSLGLKGSISNFSASHEDEYFKAWEKTKTEQQFKAKVIKISASIVYAFFILFVGFDFVDGLITIGSFYLLFNYYYRIRAALDDVSNTSSNFIFTKVSVGRFMTILNLRPSESESGLKEFPKNWKKIEFKEVSFKYKDKYVLKNFNLVINRNDKIGFVGRSGSGKSTIVKLLLKLYKPTSGEILVDNINFNLYSQDSISRNMGVVLQEPEMFNLTALDNIVISSSKIDKDLLSSAIHISALNPVVNRLPQGLNTLIGEKGYRVSGGERQRFGIARAIYKNADFMIFDEATSALDSKTEHNIQTLINQKLKDKTFIVIAHRLSTLKNVDKIVVFDHGKTVDSGSFNELIKNKGLFYHLYKIQNKRR